jgi:hypothetical protein
MAACTILWQFRPSYDGGESDDETPYLAVLPSRAARSVSIWPKTVALWARVGYGSQLWVAVLWWIQEVNQ